jgi:hypothetical protein
MTDDDLDFYYQQVVSLHKLGANATVDALRELLKPWDEHHLVQLTEALSTLVDRGRLEIKELDRKGAYAVGTERCYVPVSRVRRPSACRR